ncbi:MAG TPA: transglycosylase SLT domain-containing protein [Rhodanobacteraceae bacterium]
MNLSPAGIRLAVTLAVCGVLGACAVEPPKPPPTPATVIARPTPPPTTLAQLSPVVARGQPWAGIVASDVMDDCADSRLVRANIAMYTRSPASFEQTLAQALPLVIYVHKRLHAAGIPGEFVMLPMLESSYNAAEPGTRGSAAGMWQFMPVTARRHGVKVLRHYDGRLDPVASTTAAIRMLKAFYAQFHDWRLVAMAYNAGPQTVVAALRHHVDRKRHAIPDLRVSYATRTHLARMLALSCILREPQRYHVTLPKASSSDVLEAISIPTGTPLQTVAEMAGVPEARLRTLNPGYVGSRIPDGSPGKLLLPATAAENLTAALAIQGSESLAEADPASDDGLDNSQDPSLPAQPVRPRSVISTPDLPPAARHRVRSGETLYSIAHEYGVSVRDLMRWNDLHGDILHPGEKLRVHG